MKTNDETSTVPPGTGRAPQIATSVGAPAHLASNHDTPPPPAQRPPRPSLITSDLFASRLSFTVKETAQILGVCEKTVRRLIDRGLLRTSLALRIKLIPKHELERFLTETMN